MKINLLTLVFILLSVYCKSQDLLEKDRVGEMMIVKANISNLKNLLKISDAAFDSTLQKMGYSKFETSDGTTTFAKGTTATGGTHYVAKKTSYVAIRWFHKGNSNGILDNVLKELSPFYYAVMEGARFYKIIDETITYRFVTTVNDDSESIQLNGPRQGAIAPSQAGSRIIQVPAH